VSSRSRRYADLRHGHRRRPTSNQKFAGPAVAAGLLLALTSSHPGAAASPATTARAVSPSGATYTPSSWAAALLSAGGWPQTRCNLAAVTAWEQAEGGNWQNTAQFNPLDTTMPEPGSWGINSAGVQAYPSWRAGFTATLATLGNGNYGPILSALSSGASAQAVADAVAASPWGTSGFQASC
jgi:hypothetical protein